MGQSVARAFVNYDRGRMRGAVCTRCGQVPRLICRSMCGRSLRTVEIRATKPDSIPGQVGRRLVGPPRTGAVSWVTCLFLVMCLFPATTRAHSGCHGPLTVGLCARPVVPSPRPRACKPGRTGSVGAMVLCSASGSAVPASSVRACQATAHSSGIRSYGIIVDHGGFHGLTISGRDGGVVVLSRCSSRIEHPPVCYRVISRNKNLRYSSYKEEAP